MVQFDSKAVNNYLDLLTKYKQNWKWNKIVDGFTGVCVCVVWIQHFWYAYQAMRLCDMYTMESNHRWLEQNLIIFIFARRWAQTQNGECCLWLECDRSAGSVNWFWCSTMWIFTACVFWWAIPVSQWHSTLGIDGDRGSQYYVQMYACVSEWVSDWVTEWILILLIMAIAYMIHWYTGWALFNVICAKRPIFTNCSMRTVWATRQQRKPPTGQRNSIIYHDTTRNNIRRTCILMYV